jgi:hypothetical protein
LSSWTDFAEQSIRSGDASHLLNEGSASKCGPFPEQRGIVVHIETRHDEAGTCACHTPVSASKPITPIKRHRVHSMAGRDRRGRPYMNCRVVVSVADRMARWQARASLQRCRAAISCHPRGSPVRRAAPRAQATDLSRLTFRRHRQHRSRRAPGHFSGSGEAHLPSSDRSLPCCDGAQVGFPSSVLGQVCSHRPEGAGGPSCLVATPRDRQGEK